MDNNGLLCGNSWSPHTHTQTRSALTVEIRTHRTPHTAVSAGYKYMRNVR